MRKMRVEPIYVDMFTSDEAKSSKVYAAIHHNQTVGIGIVSKDFIKNRGYRFFICESKGGSQSGITFGNSWGREYGRDGTLKELLDYCASRGDAIYEFDTFREFCQWYLDVTEND